MDFITQTLLGTIAAQATMTPRLGRKVALFGALGGALPDFDVFLRPVADPALPFEFHRHFTHSLLFIPVAAALATGPFLLLPKWRKQAGLIFAAATIGAATHGLLDNLTSYGTHLFWPLLAGRTAWDAMSIIDPVFTGLLIVGVFLSLAIGHLRPAAVAVALALLYIVFGFVQHERGMRVQEQIAERRGHVIERGRVTPTLGNLVVWRSVYECEGTLYADAVRVRIFADPLVREGDSVPRFTVNDLADSEAVGPQQMDMLRDVFVRFSAFATDFTAVVEDQDDSSITVGDMRFSLDAAGFAPIWGLRIGPPGAAEPVRWTHVTAERPDAMREFWYELLEPGAAYAPIASVK
ncbi:MAG: metal-dependent hydrolase [Phycisphaerales bacterium]|nr:MAG: metal-dependent hydrolase [Phycisphaerales bacterium]